MKKIRPLKILLFAILGVSLCVPYSMHAIAQDRPEENRSFMLDRLVDFFNFVTDLDLTEEQKVTLQDLVHETHEAIIPSIEKMKELRTKMDEATLAEPIDFEKAIELNKKMIDVKAEIATTVLKAKLKGSQVLTPEQRVMILDKKKEHRKRMDEWRERFQEWRDYFSNLIFS